MNQEADLKQKLSEDLKQAMKDGDTQKRSVLRLLLSSVHNAEISKQSALDNSDVLGIIAKEVKQHNESIEAFKQGKRSDLVEKEEGELAILQAYMPQQMSRDEIVEAAREVITRVGAQGPADKGKVMKELMPGMKGKADGKLITDVVSELLAS
jgi:uncharacterized protein YqeY